MTAPGKVGYGLPPEANQFKKGQSGNKRGRPKDADVSAEVRSAIRDKKIKIHEDGKAKTLPANQLVAKTLVANALKGEKRALQQGLLLLKANPGMADNSVREQLWASATDAWGAHWGRWVEAIQVQQRTVIEDRQALAAYNLREDTIDAALGMPGLSPAEAAVKRRAALTALGIAGVPSDLIERLFGVGAGDLPDDRPGDAPAAPVTQH